MRVPAAAVLCCLFLTCPLRNPVRACTSFCFDTADGPVFGANCDLFIPGDGLVFVNQRGIAKEGWMTSTTGETAKWNIVYDIAAREAWFRSAAGQSIKHLSLDAFDLSCEAPLLMLDINTTLDGDVEQSFIPYDHDVNLELFSTFCARWGIKVSEEGAAELMRRFDGLECAR